MPTVGGQGTLASGETPILITWNYLAQSYSDALKGNPAVQVVIPKTGRFGGIYVQGISAFAPHPNAAKLWEEYLYSDAGQIGWLTGLLLHHPLRGPRVAQRDPGRSEGQAAG